MATESIEFLKAALNFGGTFLTLCLTWLVGNRLTIRWNLKQKKKESDLAAAQDFHRLYGEFFAVWKLWNHSFGQEGQNDNGTLFQRACAAEGGIEALLVRLAASRDLYPEDIKAFACFRQAYQTLRESIRNNQRIEWNYSEHPEYLAFKRLATYVALAIVADTSPSSEMAKSRAEALIGITSNQWEGNWSERAL